MMGAEMSPRAAAALLTEALSHLDMVQPPSAREPIRLILRAAVETCVVSHSLLGKPVTGAIELAHALVTAGKAVT